MHPGHNKKIKKYSNTIIYILYIDGYAQSTIKLAHACIITQVSIVQTAVHHSIWEFATVEIIEQKFQLIQQAYPLPLRNLIQLCYSLYVSQCHL